MVDLMKIFKRSNRTKFKKSMLQPLIDAWFIEMTEPQSLRSPTQKYRTTEKGMEIVKAYE
jgi:ATP-dependent DNA helicase RecG